MKLSRLLLPALLVVACSAPVDAPAAARDPEAGTTAEDQDAVFFRGIFGFHLPRILDPEALRITVIPRWSDFLRSDVVRVRCRARYAFSKHFEGSVEATPYFDNFGGDGPGGFGVGEYRIGAKYAWTSLLHPYVDTAFGAEVAIPAPGAVPETNIGTASFSPYVVFSRTMERVVGLDAFLNIGCELFDSDPPRSRIARYRPARDNLIVTPGVVLHRAPWHYTLAASVRSTVLAGDNDTFVSVLPSVSWEVPRKYTRFVGGRWTASGGYEAVFHRDGIESRVAGRLKWDFDWSRTVRDVGNRVRDRLPWGTGAGGRDVRPPGDAR